jgi:UDP-N-acetylmuramate-alanine ligase
MGPGMSVAGKDVGMKLKPLVVTITNQDHQRPDWYVDFEAESFVTFFQELATEMAQLGISLTWTANRDVTIIVNSYADLLNCVKVSSPEDNHHNRCIGHIIGKSEHLDIRQDIRKAVRRLAFAPETIVPETAFRKVCHNCGCGC